MTVPEGERCVAVIGCGAAGMAAAIASAECGAKVTVFEKNDRAGKKLYISGKGRCNVTNACDTADFFSAVVRGKKFLYSAVYGFDAERVQLFFTERGCPLKTERGGRVFPVSDKSSDVIRTLTREMERLRINVCYETKVRALLFDKDLDGGTTDKDHAAEMLSVRGLETADGTKAYVDAVVIATGGLTYPATGSTGDGYVFARHAGHRVGALTPSLVPFETKENWHRDLQGLTLKQVRLYTVRDDANGKDFSFDEQGDLLFTHFGISGPLVLKASAYLPQEGQEENASGKQVRAKKKAGSFLPVRMAIDCKPALSLAELDDRLLRDFSEHPRRQFGNSLGALFPAKLTPVMAKLAEAGMRPEGTAQKDEMVHILPQTPCGTLTRIQRRSFAALMKNLPVTVTATRPFTEAIITRGGVSLAEINPSTMASKRCENLYFAGEVLDCDALTGGYNLQIAWSTGTLAGKSAAQAG